MMDVLSFENEFFVLFRVCIKKIRGELLELTLSSFHFAFARARTDREKQTERETERQTERETKKKQKITHTAVRSLFALLEWGIHAALFVHSQTFSFFFASEGKKKRFQSKKG